MKLVVLSSPGNQKQYHAVKRKRTGKRNKVPGLLAVFSKEVIQQMCNKCFKRLFSPLSHCRQVHVFKYSSGFSPPAGSISFQLSCVGGNPAHTSSTPKCLMSMCCCFKQNGHNLSAQGACSPCGHRIKGQVEDLYIGCALTRWVFPGKTHVRSVRLWS